MVVGVSAPSFQFFIVWFTLLIQYWINWARRSIGLTRRLRAGLRATWTDLHRMSLKLALRPALRRTLYHVLIYSKNYSFLPLGIFRVNCAGYLADPVL